MTDELERYHCLKGGGSSSQGDKILAPVPPPGRQVDQGAGLCWENVQPSIINLADSLKASLIILLEAEINNHLGGAPAHTANQRPGMSLP